MSLKTPASPDTLRDTVRDFLASASAALSALYAARPDVSGIATLRVFSDLTGTRSELPAWCREDDDIVRRLRAIEDAALDLAAALPADCVPFSVEYSGEQAVSSKGMAQFCRPVSISAYGCHPEHLRPEELLRGSSQHNRLLEAVSALSGSVPESAPLVRWEVTTGGSAVTVLAPDEGSARLRALAGHLTREEIRDALAGDRVEAAEMIFASQEVRPADEPACPDLEVA